MSHKENFKKSRKVKTSSSLSTPALFFKACRNVLEVSTVFFIFSSFVAISLFQGKVGICLCNWYTRQWFKFQFYTFGPLALNTVVISIQKIHKHSWNDREIQLVKYVFCSVCLNVLFESTLVLLMFIWLVQGVSTFR